MKRGTVKVRNASETLIAEVTLKEAKDMYQGFFLKMNGSYHQIVGHKLVKCDRELSYYV